MRNRKSYWIASTALLIALIVVAQLLSYVITTAVVIPTPVGPVRLGQLITGSLVNLVLIVGAGYIGFSAAGTAALVSPVLAALFGIIPGGLPQLIPVIMGGNLLIVLITWFCFEQAKGLFPAGAVTLRIIGVIVGAAVKTAFLWLLTARLVAPLLHLPAQKAGLVSGLMLWPQAVTAITGGILALIILPILFANRRTTF